MISAGLRGWDRLRHGGLLLDAQRLGEVATHEPEPLSQFHERELRKRGSFILGGADRGGDTSAFVSYVLQSICGLSESLGSWQRGNQVPAEWGRVALTGETVKPRQVWRCVQGGLLPVFLDSQRRIGVGRGRRVVSRVLQWLRAGDEQLALITNGRQWRLVFAGLDFDAWCEWDVDLWFEEGELSEQVTALRTLLSPALWAPAEEGAPTPLLRAILDSRKGQADLSQELGERVREAVEALVQAHGEALKETCADVDPGEIYRAAVRVVMRMVVVLFAETRDLLPRENALYHGSYGLTGLFEELEKAAARGGGMLTRSWSAWPRVLALFRLVHDGSHHPDLPVPAYGGELFATGDPDSRYGLSRALAVFENACFEREVLQNRDVHRILERITRTHSRLRQGHTVTRVQVPVDFSDLSSEYIGILYEGLLDYELKTAPVGDPIIFLAVGNQPALPLSRLEEMDDPALKNLLEKMKDTSTGDDTSEDDEEGTEEEEDEADADTRDDSKPADETDDLGDEEEEDEQQEPDGDERHAARVRAETWAHRAVEVGKLARKPRGKVTPQKALMFEESVSRKARQLVTRVVLPGESYLVRWGGTRKGSGTFYTPPGLAVPTVQRTLRPQAYDPPLGESGEPDPSAPHSQWSPKTPEEILALKVVDPACGSGTFPVAALRFLTDALYSSLHHHSRVREDRDRSVVALLAGEATAGGPEERLHEELLPCRPDDDLFEPRLKAVLRRHVVERCIYGVDLDPLAVELCRLALWIETMDRSLPFSFLDHKIKCGNSLVGAWFDQFQHYPAMAWKNREGGDKGHTNGVQFEKDSRTKAIKEFVKDKLTPDLKRFLEGRTLFEAADPQEAARSVHDRAFAILSQLHELPVQESAERARVYRSELLASEAYESVRESMDLWCACWFWPTAQLESAPLPSTLANPSTATHTVSAGLAEKLRFFHWELEFPDVFSSSDSGFDAVLGNPPWDIAKPNSKEFFSNIDPLYRLYGKQEALRYQTGYFADNAVERDWLIYNGDFRAQSNYLKYASSAYGDPNENETGPDRFAIGRGKASTELHNRWRDSRRQTVGFADPAHPFRHQGSADINLYKLFLEQAHSLLRVGGRLGFIVPSGLYSDHGTGALREVFLERCRWEWIFGFENREGIFDIHRSQKFNPVIIEKGGTTAAIRTAFMRRRLEDWEHAEDFATSYARDQIEKFSPRSKAILEIQSARDLEVLMSVQDGSARLSDLVSFTQQFDMTGDSKLFPPISIWIRDGFRPDEYGLWISPEGAVALPVYEGRMIDQFDPSRKGWVSGRGRTAKWDDITWQDKIPGPQYLMTKRTYEDSDKRVGNFAFYYMKIASATNARTMIGTVLFDSPSVYSLCELVRDDYSVANWLTLSTILNSYAFDFAVRMRLGGLNITGYVLEETPVPSDLKDNGRLVSEHAAALSFPHQRFANAWIGLEGLETFRRSRVSWRQHWSVTPHDRLRRRCILDAVVGELYGLTDDDLRWILRDCDHAAASMGATNGARNLDPKGFWRVDKKSDPEVRQTVLTIVAFHDLQQHINSFGGDRDRGVESFFSQNDGDGWMLPETLRLADYDLGHDQRAKEPQAVSSRLGPRFYEWQLSQDPEESWRECHLHARNLLGENGYRQLLADIETEKRGEKSHASSPTASAPVDTQGQGSLFGHVAD